MNKSIQKEYPFFPAFYYGPLTLNWRESNSLKLHFASTTIFLKLIPCKVYRERSVAWTDKGTHNQYNLVIKDRNELYFQRSQTQAFHMMWNRNRTFQVCTNQFPGSSALPTRGFPGHYPACTLGAMKNLIKLMMKILLEYPGIPSAWAAHFPHAANLGDGGPLFPNLGSQIHWFWDALY